MSHIILDLKIIQNSVQKLKLAGNLSQKWGIRIVDILV